MREEPTIAIQMYSGLKGALMKYNVSSVAYMLTSTPRAMFSKMQEVLVGEYKKKLAK